jgi:histidinol-phosphate aminotransferase
MKVRPAVAAMEAYHPPLEMRSERDYLLLDFSESTQPPSPAVAAALQAYARDGRARMYPAYGRLSEKLARYVGVRPDQVLPTNGSDGAIQLILHALLEAGDEMVMAKPGFFVTGSMAASIGARVVSPLYRPDMSFPLEEVLAAVTLRTRLIVVVSPNNPTGTSAGLDQIETILQRHPDVPVFVDEAYYEFSGRTAVPLLARHDNLVLSRTFSKAMALAGLRFGYAVSNAEFIGQLAKLRIPYDVNTAAAVAAEASLDHPEGWRAYVREVMEQAKPQLERFLDERGVPYYRSDANFILVRAGDPAPLCEYLREQGILVRPQRPPVGDCFRVSIGTVAEMRRFMQAYGAFLDQPARGR